VTSPSFQIAVNEWHALRDEFELVREAAFDVAHEATNGVLLNARGRSAGIDAYSLFMGNEVRAHAYASPELIEHWRSHPRPVFAKFERERCIA